MPSRTAAMPVPWDFARKGTSVPPSVAHALRGISQQAQAALPRAAKRSAAAQAVHELAAHAARPAAAAALAQWYRDEDAMKRRHVQAAPASGCVVTGHLGPPAASSADAALPRHFAAAFGESSLLRLFDGVAQPRLPTALPPMPALAAAAAAAAGGGASPPAAPLLHAFLLTLHREAGHQGPQAAAAMALPRKVACRRQWQAGPAAAAAWAASVQAACADAATLSKLNAATPSAPPALHTAVAALPFRLEDDQLRLHVSRCLSLAEQRALHAATAAGAGAQAAAAFGLRTVAYVAWTALGGPATAERTAAVAAALRRGVLLHRAVQRSSTTALAGARGGAARLLAAGVPQWQGGVSDSDSDSCGGDAAQ